MAKGKFVEAEFKGDLEQDLANFALKIQRDVIFAGSAAMARTIYDEVKVNVAKLGRKTGKLESAIFRAYSEKSSTDERKTYRIGWRYQDAPHAKLIEFGHWQYYKVVRLSNGDWVTLKNQRLDHPKWTPAQPFLRPAFSKVNDAIKAGKARMAQKLTELENK